jgi:hypothetical protein
MAIFGAISVLSTSGALVSRMRRKSKGESLKVKAGLRIVPSKGRA